MKNWLVRFEENGGEYSGFLIITANNVALKVGFSCTVVADGIEILIDERVISIEETA